MLSSYRDQWLAIEPMLRERNLPPMRGADIAQVLGLGRERVRAALQWGSYHGRVHEFTKAGKVFYQIKVLGE